MSELDRRTFLRASVWAAAGVVLAGCTGGAGSGGPPGDVDGQAVEGASLAPLPRPTLRMGGGAFGFPSPFGYGTAIGYRQMSLLYDTLLWKDGNGQLLPWLAASFERSPDGRTYTFELRQNVRWHDGRPLTADDVVFTFNYYSEHTLGPLVVVVPHGNLSVQAAGPTRVRIQLDRPAVTFPEYVAAAVPIVPRHIWSAVKDPGAAQDTALLIGSGPYRLSSYGGDQGPLAFDAHDDFFLGRPFVRRVQEAPVADELTGLLSGGIDTGTTNVTGARPEVLAPFRASGRFGVLDHPNGFTFPLFWNIARGGILADVRFRRACAMAIDRDDLVRRLTGGNGSPGNPGFLPPSNPFHAPVEQYRYDPSGAQALLDEAGYRRADSSAVRSDPKGRPLRFELLFPSMLTPVAQVVINGLRQVGIELRPRGVEIGPALFARKFAGDYDMAITLYPGPSGPGPNADPDLLRSLFSSQTAKGLNSADGYSDTEFDDLAERQLQAFQTADRRALVARMQEILARDLPVLPLYYSTLFQIFRKSVLGQWYWTPGDFPVGAYNKQLFLTGLRQGLRIRPTR